MRSNLPEVSKGDPISADAWNDVVRRVNQDDQTQTIQRTPLKAKGEFWIKNGTNATIQAFENVPISSFASSCPNANAAKTALAQDAVVLNASGASSDFYAVALESITPGMCGRATLAQGPLVFAAIAGSDPASRNQRVKIATSGSLAGKFVRENDGDFVIVAIDSSSRFAALCRAPQSGASYTAGSGISISDSNEISATSRYFTWGFYKDSFYTQSANVWVPSGWLLFSADFKREDRKDGGTGSVVALNATSKTVVTGVNFEQKTVTTETIRVLK